MSCYKPYAKGTNQNPDVFMQNRVASLNRYSTALEDFKWALKKQEEITKRSYDTIEFYGDENAKDVVVALGTCADVLRLAEKQHKDKIGIIKVRTLKPFDEKNFVSKLPKGIKNITILERNLDTNGTDTLTSMVLSTMAKNGINAKVYSGCYGLGGKEFTPNMAFAVFENMKKSKKEFFTVGITDDVTNTSLKVEEKFKDNIADLSMRVYGLGSDGSVSSVKNTIKILGKETTSFMQGYFDYDSKKSGSLTLSHLRSSFLPIVAPFNARVVDLVVCNNQRFIEKYDLTACLKQNGTIIFNTEYDINKLNEIMPDKMKADLVRKNIKAYTINAYDIALKAGLGGKINTIMQCAMFKVSNLLPYEVALKNIEETITKTYAKKGTKIVNANLKAIKNIEDKIISLDCTKLVLKEKLEMRAKQNKFYEEIIHPTSKQKGDEIPVSCFEETGRMPTDTSKYEKRGIASKLPNWISEKCIQCGRCTMMCPHAAIRPIVVDKDKKLPIAFFEKNIAFF